MDSLHRRLDMARG